MFPQLIFLGYNAHKTIKKPLISPENVKQQEILLMLIEIGLQEHLVLSEECSFHLLNFDGHSFERRKQNGILLPEMIQYRKVYSKDVMTWGYYLQKS